MIQSIKQIFNISTAIELIEARDQFESELNAKLEPLVLMLQQNLLSKDITSMEKHMCDVEAWRVRLVDYLTLAGGFTDHAKDSTFLASKTSFSNDNETPKKVTDIERDAYRRKLSGGFVAIQGRLEGLINCVDSRVNLAKKMLGIEVDAPKKKGL